MGEGRGEGRGGTVEMGKKMVRRGQERGEGSWKGGSGRV